MEFGPDTVDWWCTSRASLCMNRGTRLSPSGAYSVQSTGARHFSKNGDYPAKCFMSDALNSQSFTRISREMSLCTR
jgi:hypothetical protein